MPKVLQWRFDGAKLCSAMTCNRLSKGRFLRLPIGKFNGERLYRHRGTASGNRNQHGGVQTSAQSGAPGDIRPQTYTYRILKRLSNRSGRFVNCDLAFFNSLLGRSPISVNGSWKLFIQDRPRRGRQAEDSGKKGLVFYILQPVEQIRIYAF